MAIIRWDPLNEVTKLQSRINHMFEDSFPTAHSRQSDIGTCQWQPVVDIFQKDSKIVIVADIPGVGKDNVSVDVKENVLTITGERPINTDIDGDDYLRRERCIGPFYRAFSLHEPINPDKIKAKFSDGVLKIELPLPEDDKPKRIQVNVE